MTPQQFIAKWQAATLSERSAYQQHFLDLCELLGQPKPAAADPVGAWYCFERGLTKTEGGELAGHGWADVWMQGRFGWEYKGKHKDLKAAYAQLLQYRESLENPPLLVVCDLNRFEIHTNFTGTAKRVHAFDLAGLAEPKNLEVLRRLFTEPESLRPGQTSQSVTEQVAEHFGRLADGLRVRGIPAHDAAHFLMKLMFCMFAEDIDLLHGKVFSRSLAGCKNDPARLTKVLASLFQAMAKGGMFGADEIAYFNGGLFADSSTIDLTPAEIQTLTDAAAPDWNVVEPHIFGTLFERTLDPAKRSQIGAHYTSSDDIRTLLEPVMMAPLRHEWQAVREKCEALLPKLAAEAKKASTRAAKESKPRRDFNKLLRDFVERLAHVTVLDPACGSGNFLYVALRLLLDLEKEVITFAASHGLGLLPQVRPTQLHGVEINPFAQELAQVVIWIGYLQWMRDNGFSPPRNPVLEPIESIENRDAILDLSDPGNPKEPEWPQAEFIVGNPPFLGGKSMLRELGDDYTNTLRKLWGDRIGPFADLCCYWFEKARSQIEGKKSKRVGLLATQGIRFQANRDVLERIRTTARIFWAISDKDWVLEGATVHVSMIGFDNRAFDDAPNLDGRIVPEIYADLTSGSNVSSAKTIAANLGRSFIGVQKSGSFEFGWDVAWTFLHDPTPSGRPNSDVIRPYWTSYDVVRRSENTWIVDFGSRSIEEAGQYEAPFEHLRKIIPQERTQKHFDRYPFWQLWRPRPEMFGTLAGLKRFIITPQISKHRVFAWCSPEVCPSNKLIAVASADAHILGTLQSRAHELWARRLGSQLREEESGFTYTPTTCFETFPFPEPSADQRAAIAEAARELDQLRTNWLNPPEWTRTEILEFPGSTNGPWARYIVPPPPLPRDARGQLVNTPDRPTIAPFDYKLTPQEWKEVCRDVRAMLDAGIIGETEWTPENPPPPEAVEEITRRFRARGITSWNSDAFAIRDEVRKEFAAKAKNQPTPKSPAAAACKLESKIENPGSAIGTVRYPRVVPKDDECAKELKKRTLTNLYNARPKWLDLAHHKLDVAVFAAYGWPATLADDELLAKLLELNLSRASTQASAR